MVLDAKQTRLFQQRIRALAELDLEIDKARDHLRSDVVLPCNCDRYPWVHWEKTTKGDGRWKSIPSANEERAAGINYYEPSLYDPVYNMRTKKFGSVIEQFGETSMVSLVGEKKVIRQWSTRNLVNVCHSREYIQNHPPLDC